jgi:hypothetical protein
MAVNKVVLGDSTLIDLTLDTATEADVVQGKTFHRWDGEIVEGTLDPNAGGGGGEPSDETVDFYDYDGTLLHSYSLGALQAMTELPPLPSHDGLICQGWNWELDTLKEYNRAVDVGASYITDDGKTRFYITVPEGRLQVDMDIYIRGDGTVNDRNGYAELDWGDGSAPELIAYNVSGSDSKYKSHTYPAAGDYVITVDVVYTKEPCGRLFSIGGTGTEGLFYISSPKSKPYNKHVLRRVEIGRRAVLSRYAFAGCTLLESITIPIGAFTNTNTNPESAFTKCTSLRGVVVPNGTTKLIKATFHFCKSLVLVSIPHSITSASLNYTYNNCLSLKRVMIPDCVTSIDSYAFTKCFALKNIKIPEGVTKIDTYAFQDCRSLEKIELPHTVTSIKNYVFSGCCSLENIELPHSLTEIGSYAFDDCYALKRLEIPNGVTSIGTEMCSYCYTLESVVLPDSIKSMGSYAFNGCSSLKSVNIPEGLTTIPRYAFGSCELITDIVLPNSVSAIDGSAFYGTSPSSVAFPNGITTISSAFSGCATLLSVTIPDSVTSIAASAFSECTSLTSLTIPSSVTSIGSGFVRNCESLKFIDFTSHTAVPTLSGSISGYATDFEIRVPAALYDEWIAATNWSTYADYIVAV